LIGTIVKRLKTTKNEEHLETLIDGLKWKYMGRDHQEIANLNIFSILHKGDKEKDNLLLSHGEEKSEDYLLLTIPRSRP